MPNSVQGRVEQDAHIRLLTKFTFKKCPTTSNGCRAETRATAAMRGLRLGPDVPFLNRGEEQGRRTGANGPPSPK